MKDMCYFRKKKTCQWSLKTINKSILMEVTCLINFNADLKSYLRRLICLSYIIIYLTSRSVSYSDLNGTVTSHWPTAEYNYGTFSSSWPPPNFTSQCICYTSEVVSSKAVWPIQKDAHPKEEMGGVSLFLWHFGQCRLQTFHEDLWKRTTFETGHVSFRTSWKYEKMRQYVLTFRFT